MTTSKCNKARQHKFFTSAQPVPHVILSNNVESVASTKMGDTWYWEVQAISLAPPPSLEPHPRYWNGKPKFSKQTLTYWTLLGQGRTGTRAARTCTHVVPLFSCPSSPSSLKPPPPHSGLFISFAPRSKGRNPAGKKGLGREPPGMKRPNK